MCHGFSQAFSSAFFLSPSVRLLGFLRLGEIWYDQQVVAAQFYAAIKNELGQGRINAHCLVAMAQHGRQIGPATLPELHDPGSIGFAKQVHQERLGIP
ncbi:MAG TPA: hypothetical protein PLL72_21185 [Burkholderiaceae bacterium]|nr:hypothetical protein [Burkholderiaceae bacterium]